MKRYKLIFIFVFLCFAMCKKENADENLCYSSTLMSQLNSGTVAIQGYTYNSNCLIHESTEQFKYQKFSYNNQNLLNKVEVAYSFNAFSCVMIPGQSTETDPRKASISEFSTFEYDNSLRLVRKSTYNISNFKAQLNSYNTYEYENDKIVRLNEYSPEGLLYTYHLYTYDNMGNITREDSYNAVSSVIAPLRSVICEFDNKNNPYRVFAADGVPGLHTNTNNIIKETTISYYGSSASQYQELNAYEYNTFDYPVKINALVCKYGK